MNKIIILVTLVLFNTFSFAQIKLGNYGMGTTIGFKNNLSFRVNLFKKILEKKVYSLEFQYTHSIWTDNLNKAYIGFGSGNMWFNMHYINDKFILSDYQIWNFYIPIGVEFYPISNNKFSIQLETGPQLERSKLGLDPGRTNHYYFKFRSVLEVNYYFRRHEDISKYGM
jgi:hypothetical protein